MSSLTLASVALTMSSREISVLVESRHDKVKQSMERLAEKGLISFTPVGENPGEQGGRPGTIYLVNKRDSYIIVAQLCPEFTARLVDRWQELEEAAQKPALDPMQVLNDPAAMRGLLLTYTEKVIALEERVGELTPKAEALDRIATADGSLCLTNAAKNLGVQRKSLIAFLSANRWIYRRAGGSSGWTAYQDKIQAGYLEHKVRSIQMPDGSEKLSEQVLITPKGLAKLARIITGVVKQAA